jgi:hypothetical protein
MPLAFFMQEAFVNAKFFSIIKPLHKYSFRCFVFSSIDQIETKYGAFILAIWLSFDAKA